MILRRCLFAGCALMFTGFLPALAQQTSNIITISCTGIAFENGNPIPETLTIDPTSRSIDFAPQPYCGVTTIFDGAVDNVGCANAGADLEHVDITSSVIHFSMQVNDGTDSPPVEDITISRASGNLTAVEFGNAQSASGGQCTKVQQAPNAF